MLNTVNIFVYGTLKPGESNYQRYCAGKVLSAKRAIARGQLFDLPMGYPAMTVGDSLVHGYLLSFPDETVLPYLDLLEDYDPHRPEAENEYNRRPIETYDPTMASLCWAWVYLMSLEQIYSCGGVLLPEGWWSGFG